MRKISYVLNGNLQIIHPCISRDDPPGFTEEDALQRARKDIPPGATDVEIIDRVPDGRPNFSG